jgi:L-amino acid N-acyltransferase YncA
MFLVKYVSICLESRGSYHLGMATVSYLLDRNQYQQTTVLTAYQPHKASTAGLVLLHRLV